MLGAAEGDARVGGDHGVDEDLAGVDAVDEAVHFGAVVRPDGGAEAEGGVVGGGDRVVDVATRKSDATGPNVSSRAAGAVGGMRASTVGA